MKLNLVSIAVSLALTVVGASRACEADGIPSAIRAAVADPARPAADRLRDAARKPAEVVAFAGVKPGDRIADFISGGGYFTRIFSRVVGPSGRVYAFLPEEQLKNCTPTETDGTRAIANDASYANVQVLSAPVNTFAAFHSLDMIWTAQNYHDLHDPFMGPADMTVLDKRIYAALKPGGVFIVIDHVAEAGSGVRDTNTLHRIDPDAIVREVEAAGFQLEAQSELLRNPADTHKLRVFDPAIRGRTDQVVLKFRKPEEAR
jgi:predicted methyltransferase